MRKLRITAAIALLSLTWISCTSLDTTRRGPDSEKQLQKAIDLVLNDSRFQNGTWAVLVTDLGTDRVLYRRNAKKSFIPASNTKIYTTASALDLLGPEYTYVTSVYRDGVIENGVLKGNLIIQGSGDPVIGGRFNDGDITETFREWAASLSNLGVHTIEGDIIGDDDIFDDVALGFGWQWDDELFWYSAEISGLSFNDNNVDFSITGTDPGMQANIGWEPLNTSYIDVVNASLTLPADSSIIEGYSKERGTNKFRIFSQVPTGRTDRESLTVVNPTLFFVHVLRETLIQNGISVSGMPVDVDDVPVKPNYANKATVQILSHTSRPLKDIIRVLNKRSQNLYAEQLLKTVGAVLPVDDPALESGSAKMGLARDMDTYAAAGVDTSRFNLVDGSGLSRMNLVTAEMTSSILRYMWNHPDDSTNAAFYRSLPIGGVDGTLRTRFRGGPAEGRVHAKTGTVTDASALSGYISSAAGTPLSFVIMCNHYIIPTSQVRAAQDQVVELLATYRR